MDSPNYALGQSALAMRRLEIQDAQFGAVSEQLLDDLEIRPDDRVVELGIGSGGLGRRIMQRLESDGVLVGVDYTQSLLDQAQRNLAEIGAARFTPVLANIRDLDDWIEDADVVLGRTVLHHIPNVESLLGSLRAAVRPGTRIGFIEPEFRALLARISSLESQGRNELKPLRLWADGLFRYYQACGLSPGFGARLALTLKSAGYHDVQSGWSECPMDQAGIENMLLFYDEVHEKYCSMGIMTADEIDQQKRLIASLPDDLPAVWGVYAVTCLT